MVETGREPGADGLSRNLEAFITIIIPAPRNCKPLKWNTPSLSSPFFDRKEGVCDIFSISLEREREEDTINQRIIHRFSKVFQVLLPSSSKVA